MHKDTTDPLNDELMAEDEKRNWKGICIAFFVISFIITLIVIAICILSPDVTGSQLPRLSLEQLLSAQAHLKPPLQDAQWISNTELVYEDKNNNLVLFDALTTQTTLLIANTVLSQVSAEQFWLSADRKFVLLQHHSRHELGGRFLARYQVFNLVDKQLNPIHAPDGSTLLQHVEWGTSGSQMLLIHQNDLYYLPEFGFNWIRLTISGSSVRSNGVCDWLYTKRLLRSRTAIRWSPDGQKLLFASFDDRQLPIATFTRYDLFEPQPGAQPPPMASIRFPKPGSQSPHVELFVLTLTHATHERPPIPHKVQPPKQLLATDPIDSYLNAIVWIDTERFAAIWTNRDQNYTILAFCAHNKAWNCEKHLDQQAENGHILPLADEPLLSSDGRHFLFKMPFPSRSDALQQVTMVTVNGRIKNVLNQQQVRVLSLLAHRTDSRTLFYLGQQLDDPTQTHVYSLPDILSAEPRVPRCLTCDRPASNCSVYRASFSRHSDYVLLHCLGPSLPWSEIRTVQHNSVVLHYEPREILSKLLKRHSLPITKKISIAIDSKHDADLLLNIPNTFHEQLHNSLPLLIQIFPRDLAHEQPLLERRLRLDLLTYLTGSRMLATARLRLRRRPEVQPSACNRRHCCPYTPQCELPLLQIALSALRQRLSFVRSDRLSLLGQSAGAYLVAQLLAQQHVHSNCSVLIAPLVDWTQVNMLDGERVYGQPSAAANLLSYERSELSRKANQLKSNNLLLIHGTADDEIHLQHSFALMKSLNQHGAVYRSQLYPDADHSLAQVQSHLFRSVELFVAEQMHLQT